MRAARKNQARDGHLETRRLHVSPGHQPRRRAGTSRCGQRERTRGGTDTLKPVDFTYHRVTSLDDALERLGAGGDGAKLIGGGQSLGPMLNTAPGPSPRAHRRLVGGGVAGHRIDPRAHDRRRRGHSCRDRGPTRIGPGLARDARGRDRHRLSCRTQPGHHWRQHRACRSGGGLVKLSAVRGGTGAHPQHRGRARRTNAGLHAHGVHHRARPGRDHHPTSRFRAPPDRRDSASANSAAKRGTSPKPWEPC